MQQPKIALVTGCSSGIGRQTALHLAARGIRVLAGVRHSEDADSLRHECADLEPLILDVSDGASIEQVAQQLARDYPQGIDGLVNNAGIAVAGPLELVDLDLWRSQYEVNVFGMVRLIQVMLPSLRKRQGRIINVGSAASHLALPMMGPYSSSKAAVERLSDALRRELRPAGIQVIVVCPGQTATSIYSKSEQDAMARLESADQPLGEDYLPRLRRFQELMHQSARFRVSPERVAVKVGRAMLASRPRSRYHVGWDASASALVDHFVPTRLVDWIISRRLRPREPQLDREPQKDAVQR